MTFPAATDAQLDAYLRRLDFAGDLRADLATLNALHLAHASRIPFENLDVLLRQPIRLDLDSLHAKLVERRRGGYCFEHNLLFAAMLERVGFAVSRLAARVRYGSDAIRPRTHMLLLVDLDGARWLADVGFGVEGLLVPVPLTDTPTRQYAWTYRVAEQGGTFTLQSLRPSGWMDLYAFTLEPQQLPDFEMANYFVSTHPDSPFVRTLTAQLLSPTVRYALRGRVLTEDRGGEIATRTLAADDELGAVLSQTFGVELPAGLTLPPA
jgi:N-hydroxyarylamine O-acetyltransferase